MLIHYDWVDENGQAPEANAEVDLSGDPDKPVLRGTIFKAVEDRAEELTTLSILLADGQPGAEEFQTWIESGGSIGIMPVDSTPRPVFEL